LLVAGDIGGTKTLLAIFDLCERAGTTGGTPDEPTLDAASLRGELTLEEVFSACVGRRFKAPF
jgi:hypothetical protein